MSMTSAMGAGVSGLMANSIRLASISDNIANSATYGYRRVETDFDSIVLGGTGGGGYAAGGVRTSNGRRVDQSGPLTPTNNAVDMAIEGGGMLPVTRIADVVSGSTNLPMLMTRTASFQTDADGYLRNDAGLALLGWAFEADGTMPAKARDTAADLVPVKLPLGQAVSSATTEIKLGVVLPVTETRQGAQGTVPPSTVQYNTNLGETQSLEINYNPIRSTNNNPSLTWDIEIKDLAQPSNNNTVGTYTVTFEPESAGDNAGTIKSVTGTGLGGEQFDPTTGIVKLKLAGGTEINLNLGKLQDRNGSLQQRGDTYAQENIVRNGASVGRYLSAEIDKNGLLRVKFDNDSIQLYYKIPVVSVANMNGLTAGNSQTYTVSKDSGRFFLWDAGDGPAGEINGYAREASATDIAKELTNMIQTQRAYSSNAKTIQTVDEMMQETTNIKR